MPSAAQPPELSSSLATGSGSPQPTKAKAPSSDIIKPDRAILIFVPIVILRRPSSTTEVTDRGRVEAR